MKTNKKPIDSFKTLRQLNVNGVIYYYFSLPVLEATLQKPISTLPHTLKILLENLLRCEDGDTVKPDDIHAMSAWLETKKSDREIAYRPARVLMQDFTGVPAIVDLAAMRDAVVSMGYNPLIINPLTQVDLVIDHSIQVDAFAASNAVDINTRMEMDRNIERYEFLNWGQRSFDNFRVVPPETGICHQVNLEYLAKTVWYTEIYGKRYAYPDTLVGTDSHTTMINGLGVLGWGVGGIEAEAAMLGQAISMLIPEVVGVKLRGKLAEGVTATDLVLTLTQLLRKRGVVGKFVEYYGPGLAELTVADRATIANMAPEYGATCGFFPIDQATLDYLRLTGREEATIALVSGYAKAQGLWQDEYTTEMQYTDVVELDLSQVEPSVAGPKRPQDRVLLTELKHTSATLLDEAKHDRARAYPTTAGFPLHHGDVVIAAITSCTNTSNPSVLMAAGLVAKKAVEKGLRCKPWVKTSLAPGSQVVTQYLQLSGLQTYLDNLGFNLVGYGCTTCIGNSGPLPDPIAETIAENDLTVSAVLSGNRNFEGRIHPQVKANWLASPPLVVLFALAGTTVIDLTQDAIAHDADGKPVFMRDLWPSNAEIAQEVAKISSKMYKERYADVFTGNDEWQSLDAGSNDTYIWDMNSTYIQQPPFFSGVGEESGLIHPINNARILAMFGDSITTDHISPAGSIKADTPAGTLLQDLEIKIKDFNSYGARRGNHEIMMRGTFANIRIRNEMVEGTEGGMTLHYPDGEKMTIYAASTRYRSTHTPSVVIAGKEYGTGSSRDWAAKGPKLLGVAAVLAESFERIHRSNLVGMGILPLQFKEGENRKTLNLDGSEIIHIPDINNEMKPSAEVKIIIERKNGSRDQAHLLCRIDTQNEVEYYRNGGILPYVMRKLVNAAKLDVPSDEL